MFIEAVSKILAVGFCASEKSFNTPENVETFAKQYETIFRNAVREVLEELVIEIEKKNKDEQIRIIETLLNH